MLLPVLRKKKKTRSLKETEKEKNVEFRNSTNNHACTQSWEKLTTHSSHQPLFETTLFSPRSFPSSFFVENTYDDHNLDLWIRWHIGIFFHRF